MQDKSVFRYREVYRNPSLSKFTEVTVDNSIYNLLAIFLIECLARFKDTEDVKKLYEIFRDSLENWQERESSEAISAFYQTLMLHKTLISRFDYISQNISSIRDHLIKYMGSILNPKAAKKSTRDLITLFTSYFNLYINFRGTIFPKDQPDTRLLGYFGVKEDRYLCIYYTESMTNIDNSLEKISMYPTDIYYYTPDTEKLLQYSSAEKISKVTTSKSSIKIETSKDNLVSDTSRTSRCEEHDPSQVMYLACGFNHCILCLYNSIENNKPVCGCEMAISQKDLSTVKKRALELLQANSSIKKVNKQVSSKNPPPPLVAKKEKVTKIESENIKRNSAELVNKIYTMPVEYSNFDFQDTECFRCKGVYHKSEFIIKCGCEELVCTCCRLECLEKCLKCGVLYDNRYKISLGILKVTKINNY